jgi:hypothetical protein
MMMSANRASAPDNDYGWGVPDILAAIQYSFDMTGDLNGDEQITISDVIYLVNYLYRAGPAPSPLSVADADCDGDEDAGDVVYLVNYLFKGGPGPCSR